MSVMQYDAWARCGFHRFINQGAIELQIIQHVAVETLVHLPIARLPIPPTWVLVTCFQLLFVTDGPKPGLLRRRQIQVDLTAEDMQKHSEPQLNNVSHGFLMLRPGTLTANGKANCKLPPTCSGSPPWYFASTATWLPERGPGLEQAG
jgi:hypothetical protein